MQFGTRVGGGVTKNCGGQGGVAGAVMGNVAPVVVGEDEKCDGVPHIDDLGEGATCR